MYYPCFLSPRRLVVVSSLLALLSAAVWLSPPGTAQENADRRIYSSQDAPGNRSVPDNNETPQNSAGPEDLPDDGLNGEGTGGSARPRSSETTQDPAVGVDTVGHTDVTATRNGRTTRRRPPAPANPLVITNPNRPNADSAMDLEKRLSLPPRAKQPGVYTIPSDAVPSDWSSSGLKRDMKPLPLFGYDFFQPARQIIRVRRLALMPALPRTTRTRGRASIAGSANETRSRLPVQTGQDTGEGNNRGDLTNADSNGESVNGGLTTGDLAGAAVAGVAATGARRDRSTMGDNSEEYGQDAPGTDGGTSSDQSAPGNHDRNGASGNASDTTGTDSTNSDTAVTDNSANVPGQTTRRRPAAPESSFGGDTFPGDTQAPGSDIQFPGDDALGQGGNAGGATNAVTGEVADPLDTLYRNTLVSLPANYQLQPGDSLIVRYSALTVAPREFTAVVDVQGGINVAGIGRVSVAGRTATEAETALRQRLERLYRNVDVSISLRQLRTIQVTISGAAFAPGTYTVPATATAFNVLNAAGGPTANGSLRDIRVLRGGRLAGIVDIYPLIGATSGSPRSRSGDLNLQAGDNIYIPARLSRITIRGQVRQEAVYELTPTETLRDALSYAGGIKPSGVGQTIHIDTVDPGVGRILTDVTVTTRAAIPNTPLYDGDTVEIASVRTILTNRVTILGAVQQPGDYALTRGMRVLDLLQRARGTLPQTYLGQAQLISQNPDQTTRIRSINIADVLDGTGNQNVPLARNDILHIYSRQDVAYLGRRQVTVRGAVQRPGLYTQSDNMHVSDLLLATGGPLTDAYLGRAVLLHQHGDGTFAYDYINLHDVLSRDDPTQDLPIADNDILAVYRVGEAHFTPDHTVKVLGNVVAPGLYARGENMRLSDLLKLSGGFKPGGGTRVTVAHARRPAQDAPNQVSPLTVAFSPEGTTELGTDMPLQDGDVVAVQGNGSIKDHPAVITVTGAVNRPGPISLAGNTRLSDAVREAGGLRPEAFPQGAEFTRMSDALATSGQLNLADVISHMSDMLNLSQYQRERAKASLALIQAAGSAASGGSSLPIPGLGGAAPSAPANVGGLVDDLRTINPVSQGRILTPSQLLPNGGVAVRLAEALRHPGSNEDILLKDGDTLVVPETPTTVQVVGAVYNNSGVVYHPGESIDYYIQHAGDFTPDAAKDRIEVIHAGGGLIPAGKAGAIQPGDLIFVPTKVLAEKVGNSSGGFSAFFQGLVGSAVTLKVLTSVFGL